MKRPLLLLLLVASAAYAVLVFLSSEFYLAQQDRAGIATPLPMKFAHVDHSQQRQKNVYAAKTAATLHGQPQGGCEHKQ